MIARALANRLTTSAAVAARVSNRVYPGIRPQGGELPAITYHRISAVRDYTHDGPSGLARPRYQLDLWDDDHDRLEQLAKDVRQALEGFRGDWGTSPAVAIEGVFFDNESDEYDEDAGLYRIRQDYFVQHQEEVAA